MVFKWFWRSFFKSTVRIPPIYKLFFEDFLKPHSHPSGFVFLMNPNLSQQDAVFWLKNKSKHAILKDSSATCIENSGARIEKIQMVNSLIRVVVWPNVRAVKNFLSWLLFHPSFVWLSLLAWSHHVKLIYGERNLNFETEMFRAVVAKDDFADRADLIWRHSSGPL